MILGGAFQPVGVQRWAEGVEVAILPAGLRGGRKQVAATLIAAFMCNHLATVQNLAGGGFTVRPARKTTSAQERISRQYRFAEMTVRACLNLNAM